jgi:hypothetical protein
MSEVGTSRQLAPPQKIGHIGHGGHGTPPIGLVKIRECQLLTHLGHEPH